MKAFDFLLFLEPLLAVDVDLLRVREIYLGRHSPHTRLKMTHFSVLHLLLLPLTPHLLSFLPPLLPPPLGQLELRWKERWMMLF